MWDAVLARSARRFLDTLSPEESADCEKVVLDELCNNPDPQNNPGRQTTEFFPYRPGLIECVIGDWYFLYRIENQNTIEVARIFYGPSNSKHPMFRYRT